MITKHLWDIFRRMIGETLSTKDSLQELVSEEPSMKGSWRRILYEELSRRISGRRGRKVKEGRRKIRGNRSFLRICCVVLSILRISWATGVGLSWFFLGWKDNFRGYDSYEDDFFRFGLYKGGEGLEVTATSLTKDDSLFSLKSLYLYLFCNN